MGRQDVSTLIASFRDKYRDLLRFLTRRTGDAERAADLAQDTYVKLAALGPVGGEIRNPRAYVYRVAGNLAIDGAGRCCWRRRHCSAWGRRCWARVGCGGACRGRRSSSRSP